MNLIHQDMESENVKRGRSSVARNAGIVSLAVMASRVLGLVRDQVFAIFFGAGLYYDAFLTAFRIPNLLRDLFAEGALSAAFVTTFSQVLATKGEEEAIRLSNRVATLMILVITAISLVGWWHAPAIVHMLAPGFYDVPGKAELTIKLTRIMIPFLLLVALAAQAMGILNARGRFGIPALASAFFNVGSIMGGLLLGFAIGPAIGLSAIEGMAYGTLIGGFLQFAVQWPSLIRAGFSYRPMISISDPGVRQILQSDGTGDYRHRCRADQRFRQHQFCLIHNRSRHRRRSQRPGVLVELRFSFHAISHRRLRRRHRHRGVAAALAQQRANGLHRIPPTLAHSLALVFLLCVPSAVGLAVLGRPIVALIFEHGKFTAFDTMQTGNALAAYSIGLAGYAAVKVLSPAFYALKDARTPMLISLGSIAVNYVMNSLLVEPFGHVGLAFSTSTVALVNFILLALFMRRRIGRLEGSRLGTTLVRICVASIPMAAVAWLVSEFCGSLPLAGIVLKLVRVSASITLAAIAFYIACRLLRIAELDEAIDAIAGRFVRVLRRR